MSAHEFFNVLTPADAWDTLHRQLRPLAAREPWPTADALGRVLAVPLAAPHSLPEFPRATVDGYAVRAQDTYGASASLPAYLMVTGEVPMGALAGNEAAALAVGMGEAVIVHTGGMLPRDADAVVMVEQTERMADGGLEVYRAAARGENVVQVGEDVQQGQALLAAGHRLRPQDLGGLLALGITQVEVVRPPRVAILSQGDEVVPPDATPAPGQVRDINSYTLAALTRRAGAEPLLRWGILPDRFDALHAAARDAFAQADVVVFTAGSSVSARDMTAAVIARLGSPGVLAHGISVKPGKPTVVAVCDGKPVFGLPGNPVSAMVVFQLLVAPALAFLQGAPEPPPRTVTARLARNIASQAGREDYVPVQLVERDGAMWAEPVFGKSNLIYTLVRADGLLQVPLAANGLAEGDTVAVRLF